MRTASLLFQILWWWSYLNLNADTWEFSFECLVVSYLFTEIYSWLKISSDFPAFILWFFNCGLGWWCKHISKSVGGVWNDLSLMRDFSYWYYLSFLFSVFIYVNNLPIPNLGWETKFFVSLLLLAVLGFHWIILNKSISLNRAIKPHDEQKSNSSSIWEITFEVDIILYHFSSEQFRLIGRKNQFLVIISTNWNALTRCVLNYIE